MAPPDLNSHPIQLESFAQPPRMTVGTLIDTFLKEKAAALRTLVGFVLGSWVDHEVASNNLQPPPAFEAHDQLANPDSQEQSTGNPRLQLWALLVICERAGDWIPAFPGGVSLAQMIDLRVLLAAAVRRTQVWLERQRNSEESVHQAEEDLAKLRHAWDSFRRVSSSWLSPERPGEIEHNYALPQQQQHQRQPSTFSQAHQADQPAPAAAVGDVAVERFPADALPNVQEQDRQAGRHLAKNQLLLPHIWDDLQERACHGPEAQQRLLMCLRRLAGRSFRQNDPAWELSNCLAEVTERQAEVRVDRDILPDVDERLRHGDASGALAAMHLWQLLQKLGQQISDSSKMDHLLQVLGNRGIPELWTRCGQPSARDVDPATPTAPTVTTPIAVGSSSSMSTAASPKSVAEAKTRAARQEQAALGGESTLMQDDEENPVNDPDANWTA